MHILIHIIIRVIVIITSDLEEAPEAPLALTLHPPCARARPLLRGAGVQPRSEGTKGPFGKGPFSKGAKTMWFKT